MDANNKKLKFEGDIESKSGHIALFAISGNTLTSGGVGLCSDTTPGAVAFWAGNTNRNAAPFRVTNTGELDCSNINIIGGSIKIGSKFLVDNGGRVTCSDITITGGNVAWDVIAGANEKVTTITKNTVTTSYVNALNIKAGSVDAENITGTTITGKKFVELKEKDGTSKGSIEIGLFKANGEEVIIDGFMAKKGWSRHVFQCSDGVTGLSAEPENDGDLYMWAGWYDDNNYSFCVNNRKEVHTYKLYCHDDHNWWNGRTVTNCVKDLYDKIDDKINESDVMTEFGNIHFRIDQLEDKLNSL